MHSCRGARLAFAPQRGEFHGRSRSRRRFQIGVTILIRLHSPNSPSKFRHCRFTWVRDALALQHLTNRQPKYFQVKPHRSVVDIPDIKRKAFIPRGTVAPMHLSLTRYAWSYFVSTKLFGRIKGKVLREQWPWADQAHLATKHVPELRRFVNAARAQEAAESPKAGRVRQRHLCLIRCL